MAGAPRSITISSSSEIGLFGLFFNGSIIFGAGIALDALCRALCRVLVANKNNAFRWEYKF